VDHLPHARNPIGRILRQQVMQKGGAGARQTGDEEGPRDRLIEDFRGPDLLLAQPQQVREKPDEVPARSEMPEKAQLRLLGAGAQQHLQAFPERRVAEIDESRAAPRPGDQRVGAQRGDQQGGSGHPGSASGGIDAAAEGPPARHGMTRPGRAKGQARDSPSPAGLIMNLT
jgi:hypothetical protein